MPELNWRRYREPLASLIKDLLINPGISHEDLLSRLRDIFQNDPAYGSEIFGVDSTLLEFVEFLFFKAEGPYTKDFVTYAGIIRSVCQHSLPLCALLNRNSADAIGNMILNQRGNIKFSIADHLELQLLLQWWSQFGLEPVSEREVFDAIMQKSSVVRRIPTRDPALLLRLVEVFPAYQHEYWPIDVSLESLASAAGSSIPLPSHRRYRQVMKDYLAQGLQIRDIIKIEEHRVLPLHVARNNFLAYLVRSLHQETCQICSLGYTPQKKTRITVHHVKPLGAGGPDTARNMLVVCLEHHALIHSGVITTDLDDLICIRYAGVEHLLSPNF
jgi:hypothetical protein